MKYTGKFKVRSADERQQVSGILAGNGYIVWLGKEPRLPNKKTIDYYVYYLDPEEGWPDSEDKQE